MKILLSHAGESKPLLRRLTETLPLHVSIWLERDMMAPGRRFGPRIETASRRQGTSCWCSSTGMRWRRTG